MKVVAALVVALLLQLGANAGAASSLPSSTYPPPIAAAHHGYLKECPNPEGIVPFTSTAVASAVREAADFPTASRAAQQLASDRSFWPMLHGSKPGFGLLTGDIAYSSEPIGVGVHGPALYLIERSCGDRLVKATETVVLVPLQPDGQPQNCSDCRVRLLYIDRHGRPLLYFLF